MKKIKSLTCILALITLLACIPFTAFADGIQPMSVSKGSSTISASGKTVSYGATSTGSGIEDTIYVTANLQEYTNGVWVTIASVSNNKTKAMTVSTSGKKTVAGGTYYRTSGFHKSVTGGVTKSFYSYSNQLWVP